VIVSQHGCDGHAWDPLAHLRLTTTAMGAAARLVDALAHRHAAGRWLATGGGGYDVYRVVPRAWSLVWLAGAHRRPPDRLPEAWRQRWAEEAAGHGVTELPERFEDDEETGRSAAWFGDAERRTLETVELVRRLRVPAILRFAADAGWWRGDAESGDPHASASGPGRQPTGDPEILAGVDPGRWSSLRLASRVVAPLDPATAHGLLATALSESGSRAVVTAAVNGAVVGGLAVSAWNGDRSIRELLALGVAPEWRRRGLGRALLDAHVGAVDGLEPAGPFEALVTAAERDPVDPLPRNDRVEVARRLLGGTGFRVDRARGDVGRADPLAILGVRGG
jgi:hypothetical protein